MESNNIMKFANELGEIVDQPIGLDHIYISVEGRTYYIQPPKVGAPMLLHHYRGPFFVDLHPDDYNRIVNGEISAHEYILSANWLIGYYWGGGSMIGGGYYQPFDIVGRKEEVRRYFKILSCRGNWISSLYMPSEAKCAACPLENCPFSESKEGDWEKEMPEVDLRVDLLKRLIRRFEQEYSGYTLRGMHCGAGIPDGTIVLNPNWHESEDEPYSFMVCISSSVIQSLLMHEIEMESLEEYVGKVKFQIVLIEGEEVDVTLENIERAFEEKEMAKKPSTPSTSEDEVKLPFWRRVWNAIFRLA